MAANIDWGFLDTHRATNQHVQGNSLNDFKGSDEEKIVQNFFQVILTNPGFARFINLEIHNCNAEDGTCFSDAYISLRTTYECLMRARANFVTERPRCEGVEIKDVLNTNSLEDFRTGGVDAIGKYTQPDVCRSFWALLNFLREIKTHESAIRRLINIAPKSTTKETQIMTGLAHHLFSPLVPSNKYEVDKYAELLPKTCVCGCNGNICGGDTSLGSRETWHGRVDIMVNDVIAVAIGKEQATAEDEKEEDTVEDEPPRKQIKLETDKSCDICVEAKGNRRHNSVLLDLKVLNQILAEAMINGFAQVNKNKSKLSHFLIPTFGATSDHVTVCLYDCENDCLLHIDDELQLWDVCDTQKLDHETIIIIWLFLNFTLFSKRNLAVAAKLKKSGLHKILNENLKYYKQTKAKAKFDSHTLNRRPWIKTTVELKHPDT